MSNEKEGAKDGFVITTTKSKPFSCEIDVPTILSSSQLIAWSEDDSADRLSGTAFIVATAKRCLPILNKVVVNGIALTQANFDTEVEKPDFPARVLYVIANEAQKPILEAMDKKK